VDPVEVVMLKGKLGVVPPCQFNTIATTADYVADINIK
jgi:hypothetical protein